MSSSKAKKKPKKGSRDEKQMTPSLAGSASPSRRSILSSVSMPTAIRARAPFVGLSDVIGHTVSWVMGNIYVGDGNVGVAGQLYLSPVTPIAGKSLTICKGFVPIAPADTNFGAAHIADVMKHYARCRVRKQSVHLHPYTPATSNSLEVVVAPAKGAYGLLGLSAISNGDAGAGSFATNPIQSALSLAGYFTAASWEAITSDIAKFVAGGFGAQQNEFAIANAKANDSTLIDAQGGDLNVPTTLYVGGGCTTAALNGQNSHAVVITQTIDLLDYVGAANVSGVVGEYRRPSVFEALSQRSKFARQLRDLNLMLGSDCDDRKEQPIDGRASQTGQVATVQSAAGAAAAAGPAPPLRGGWFGTVPK